MRRNKPGTVAGDTAMLPPPAYTPIKENEQVLLSFGITADHIAALPLIVQSGPAFLVLEIRSEEVLPLLRPVAPAMELLAAQYHLAGFCLFYRNNGQDDDVVVRLFPGIVEKYRAGRGRKKGAEWEVHDPIHHSAAALVCYLYDIAMIKKEVMRLRIKGQTEQAFGPDVPVAVRLHLHDGKIRGIFPVTDL